MRSILIQIPLRAQVWLGPFGMCPVFGAGLLLALWVLAGFGWAFWFRLHFKTWRGFPVTGALFAWSVVALILFEAPRFAESIPIYGYGMMLFLGFLTAAWFAARRLRAQGYDGEISWDVAMWIFVGGIVGARLFFVVQYRDKFFKAGQPFMETLMSLVNLPDGGLVFYGGAIVGSFSYWLFCRLRRLHPLALADILITSIFIGMVFGRVGCLLNGCCYGDVCSLPWAVTFPPESVPYAAEVNAGLISGIEPDGKAGLALGAARSLPLHPTQLYSALSALVLALLTWAYYPFRQKDGEVLALGWLLEPVTRFTVEFLRGDERGQFGTFLTISQWVSIGLFTTGLIFLWLIRDHRRRGSLLLQGDEHPRGWGPAGPARA